MSQFDNDFEDDDSIDDLARRLASYDEQLRSGQVKNFPDATTIAASLFPESSVLIECLHVLERAWPRSSAAEKSVVPSQIGRFQVDRVLGVGGFGVVYKAFDPRLQRDVALKVPRLHTLSSPELLARFEREATAAASLDHLNIVPVFETGQAGQNYYIASAYCSGPDLAVWLKSQKTLPPIRDIVMIIRELATAVEYSHSKGVLHRDLKPGNVMLVPRSDASTSLSQSAVKFIPRLTDFGLARLIENLDKSTVNPVAGTPAYMAPEQTGTYEFAIGEATDIYGLGAILYEMLTGRPPFQGTNMADLFDQIRSVDPVAPRRLRRDTPNDLETICLKCLRKNPKDRFTKAKDLVDELNRYLNGEPIQSRPTRPYVQLMRWCRRKPAAAGLIGMSIFTVFIINGLLAIQNHRLTSRNQEINRLSESLVQAVNDARSMQFAAEDNERKAMEILYAADINRAAAAWKEDDTSVMAELLERHIPKQNEPDRRGFEWQFLHRQIGRSHRVLLETGSAIYHLQLFSDHRRMAAAGFDAIVRIFDLQTGEITQEIRTGQIEVNGLAMSPDGNELATAGDDGSVRIWSLATGLERIQMRANHGKAYQLFYTSDGRQIVVCGSDPVIRVFDAKTGEEKVQLSGHTREVQTLTHGSDGRMFVSCSMDGTVNRWDLTGKDWKRLFDHNTPLGPIVLLENRDLLLVGSDKGDLLSCRVSSPSVLSTAKHLDGLDSIAVHPNGKIIATGTGGGSIRWWNLTQSGELTEFKTPPLQAHKGSVYSLVWSGDGARLISAGKDGRVISWSFSAIESNNPRRISVPSVSAFYVYARAEIPSHLQTLPSLNALSAMALDQDAHSNYGTLFHDHYQEYANSPNGRFLACVQGTQELHLFQAENSKEGRLNMKPIQKWMASGRINHPRFSPDSETLAVSHWYRSEKDESTEHFVWLLSLPDLEKREQIPVPNAKSMEFSPNGEQLLLATQAGLTLWDLVARKVIWDVPRAEQSTLAFSRDGQFVATGGDDRFVTIRNALDGKTRYRMSGHRGRLRGLAFSPDGRTLASTDSFGALKLWSVTVGQELFEFQNPDTLADEVEFSADGSFLLMHIENRSKIHELRKTPDELLIYDVSESEADGSSSFRSLD